MRVLDNHTAINSTWPTFAWPHWVPASIRVQIEDLWQAPSDWLSNRVLVGAPILGAAVHLNVDGSKTYGLYVHLRDLTGRVVAVHPGPVRIFHTTLAAGTPRWVPHP